jgi:bifunctional non-homologous end joining protein LigD
VPLDKYRSKRVADRTPEPFGTAPDGASGGAGGRFVIQKHAARRLHYDFRLEMEGVLRSWAVPRGPSLNPKEKRLAVMVEDHPIEYGDFEGTIPTGNYGAGAVIGWDRGEYRPIDPPGDPASSVRAGKLDFELHGFKLRGAYTLVRTAGMKDRKPDGKEQWLLIKKRDQYASEEDVLAGHPGSVLSGLTLEELRDGTEAGSAIARELVALNAPPLQDDRTVKSFPLMLAKLAERPFDGDGWLFELKYDGVRALAIRDGAAARIFGRSGAEITAQYPEVALALDKLPFPSFVLDGEIVAFDEDARPSFQLLQRRIGAHERRDIEHLRLSIPVCYQVFDLLAFENFDLRSLALERRKAWLARVIKGEGTLRYCDHYLGRGQDFFTAVAAAGLEGILAKRRESPYRGTRSGDWLKLKCPRGGNFVIGGWTDPGGARLHFGALLLGAFEPDGSLRFISRAGTGFDETKLREIRARLDAIARAQSPFRRPAQNEPRVPSGSHFCEPQLVCEVQFSEWTDEGGLRHPSFRGLIDGADPKACVYPGAARSDPAPRSAENRRPEPADAIGTKPPPVHREFKITNADKVFWPAEGYTKGDLIEYYRTIAPWMLPYLKDRPVVLTRYPDGIEGKSFFQKDAPAFAPDWIRTEKIYSQDSQRDISYFILESAEAIGYMANLGAIPIHIWSSRITHLERPDWLLFDIDPKGSTTARAVIVARTVAAVLRETGLRPYLKTSGQRGLHVVVGLEPRYTYEQARMFAELVSRLVIARIPDDATLNRDPGTRGGRVYIDYLQLGHGKTIAAPFAVRPVPGASASAPLKWPELRDDLDPVAFNIRTMPRRMARLKRDPFLGALEDQQAIEPALAQLEKVASSRGDRQARTRR